MFSLRWRNEAPFQTFRKNQVHLRLTLLILDLENTSKVPWTKRGTYSGLRMSMSSCFIRGDIMEHLVWRKVKKADHILAEDVFSMITPTVKNMLDVLLVWNCVLSLLSLLFTIFMLSLSVHNRKLPALLTFWSSSLVQGPFTSSGLSTFCQRCWHWPSVLPWNTATQSRTRHTRDHRSPSCLPSQLHVQLSRPLSAN